MMYRTVYQYDLHFVFADKSIPLSVKDEWYESEDKARLGGQESIDWYLRRSFVGADRNQFRISTKKMSLKE